MERIKKVAKLLCIYLIALFAGMFFSTNVRAENLELNSERTPQYKYNMHEFCNSEVMAFIRHKTFYFDTDIGLPRFIDGENYYLIYDTNKHEATGNILVLGFEGDTISSIIAENEKYFLENAYYGKNRADHINFTYLNPEEMTVTDLNGYDMIIIEESVEDCYISEEIFFCMDQMINDDQYFIYDKNMLNQYHSKETYGIGYSFEPLTGELILFNCGMYKSKSKSEAEKSFQELLCSLYDKDLVNGGAFSFSFDDVEDIVVINGSSVIDYVGAYNFSCFPNLRSIVLPEKCTKIYEYAFEGCSLLDSFDFSNITEIRKYAFSGCGSLAGLNFSENLTSISEYAFQGINEEDLIIPGSVKEIGQYAFKQSAVQELKIEEGVTDIGSFAFAYCDNLKSIEIPESMAKLSEYAFSMATKVKEVFIRLNEQGLELQRGCFSDCNQWCDLFIVYGDSDSGRKQLFSVFVDNNCEQSMSNLIMYTKNNDVTLKYVGEEIKEHTITFDANGGTLSEIQEMVVEEGGRYPELPIPVHSNETLIFEGWFTEDGTEIEEGKIVDITADCTVKARWFSEETYTVSFYDSFSEEIVGTEEVYNGEKWEDILPEPEDFQMGDVEGSFQGWYTESDTEIEKNTLVNLNDDVVLYSKYFTRGQNLQYRVTFPEYGKSIWIKKGEAYSKYNIPRPSRAGDELLGWGTNKRVPKKSIINLQRSTFKFNKNVSLYAIWKSEYNAKYIETTQRLTMIPNYYLNANNTGRIYYDQVGLTISLNETLFNKQDEKNADWLLSKILKIKTRNKQVIVLPSDHALPVNKYKKYGIIETEWTQETMEKALTLMYCKYFQYLQLIQTPHFTTEKEFYEDSNWKKKLNYKLKVNDFECSGVRDNTNQRVYTIDQDIFKEYYDLCSYVEKEVLKISSGFNKNTTVTRAISGINKILTDHYKYDNEKNIYDLYWFFKTKDHRGVCASYSKFAFAVLGKCGYEALPCVGYTGKAPVHSINKTIIDGKTYYCDFCWDSVEKTTNYLYMNLSEMNSMEDHQTPKPDACGVKIKITNDSKKAEPVKIRKCNNRKAGKINLEYSRISGVTGYVIQYGTDKTFNNTKVTKKLYTSQTKKILSNLKKGRIYYIRIRTYKKSVRNNKIIYYGNWSKTKKIKINK